jgi:hypothetical protein
MRTSEIFGLPWSNFCESDEEGQSYFMVNQIAYRGNRYKRTKNDASKYRVPIGARALEALLQWKKESPDTSPDALVSHPRTRTDGPGRGPYVPRYLASEEDPPYREEARGAFQSELPSNPQDRLIPGSGAGAALATAQSFLRRASPNYDRFCVLKAGP